MAVSLVRPGGDHGRSTYASTCASGPCRPQCGRHLTSVIADNVAEGPLGLRQLDASVVRFVDNGWSELPIPALDVSRDEGPWGGGDPA